MRVRAVFELLRVEPIVPVDYRLNDLPGFSNMESPQIGNPQEHWRNSILQQLQRRKLVEHNPFEEICSFANSLFDQVDICKSDNLQLSLQREQLQQQLLGIQQTLLAGGSAAAKTILNNLSSTGIGDEKEILRLREDKEKLENRLKTLTDEYLALTLSYKSLEKRYHALRIECDTLSAQILAMKREDAERLNAENDRIMKLQQEQMKKKVENNVAELTKLQLAKQADDSSPPAGVSDNFDMLDVDEDLLVAGPSRIPGEVELAFDGHEGEAFAINWNCASSIKDDYLATGGSDRRVKIWKISDGTNYPVATLLGSNASITSIDVEGDAILASSNDYATRIWSRSDHKLKKSLTGHSNKVLSAKFLGAPHKVGSGSQDRTIKIWDVSQGSSYRTYFTGSSCFDLVYNNYTVITGHFDAKIRCWDLNSSNNESTGQIVLQSKITSLDVSTDGTKLLCSLRDNTIKCLDLRRMEVLQTYSDEKFKIGNDTCRAKFSVDGYYIACGSFDGSLYIWDANTAKVEKVLAGNGSTLYACCWSPDGRKMASVGKKVSIYA